MSKPLSEAGPEVRDSVDLMRRLRRQQLTSCVSNERDNLVECPTALRFAAGILLGTTAAAADVQMAGLWQALPDDTKSAYLHVLLGDSNMIPAQAYASGTDRQPITEGSGPASANIGNHAAATAAGIVCSKQETEDADAVVMHSNKHGERVANMSIQLLTGQHPFERFLSVSAFVDAIVQPDTFDYGAAFPDPDSALQIMMSASQEFTDAGLLDADLMSEFFNVCAPQYIKLMPKQGETGASESSMQRTRAAWNSILRALDCALQTAFLQKRSIRAHDGIIDQACYNRAAVAAALAAMPVREAAQLLPADGNSQDAVPANTMIAHGHALPSPAVETPALPSGVPLQTNESTVVMASARVAAQASPAAPTQQDTAEHPLKRKRSAEICHSDPRPPNCNQDGKFIFSIRSDIGDAVDFKVKPTALLSKVCIHACIGVCDAFRPCTLSRWHPRLFCLTPSSRHLVCLQLVCMHGSCIGRRVCNVCRS